MTGVEDLLQEDVKQCIEDFRDAGMRVWMLTGDKGATAKEIAFNCGLLDKGDGQATLPSESTQHKTWLQRLDKTDYLTKVCPPISK